MNKQQFAKFFEKFLGSDDQNSALSEYVTVFLIFLYNFLCFSSLIFSVFDTNGNGTVDFSEFVLTLDMTKKSDLDTQVEPAFTV